MRNINYKVPFASDGSDLYINSAHYGNQNYLVKAKFYGKYIYFEDNYNNMSSNIWIGGFSNLIASQFSRPFVLDTESGNIIVLSNKNIDMLCSKYPEQAKVYEASEKNLIDVANFITAINASFE